MLWDKEKEEYHDFGSTTKYWHVMLHGYLNLTGRIIGRIEENYYANTEETKWTLSTDGIYQNTYNSFEEADSAYEKLRGLILNELRKQINGD